MTKKARAFTIVELLIVIVIIAILAAISIVLYSGIQQRAVEAALQADLRNAATKIDIAKAQEGSYPDNEEDALSLFVASSGTAYQYTLDGAVYYLSITSSRSGISGYCKPSTGPITEGVCPGHIEPGSIVASGDPIQTVTPGNCPAARTMVVDARDNRTYWVQRMGDGVCWMLTNLAYAGGGTNTYGDVKPLANGVGGAMTYTVASYYSPSGSNATNAPTLPSTSTTGTGQYGYLYNWCGAMGGQLTAACANAATPAPDPSVSVCPAGWRLPTGNGGEVGALNSAVNGGLTNDDSGLRTDWLAHRSGLWGNGFSYQGSYAYYWTSTQQHASNAYRFLVNATFVTVSSSLAKDRAFAVRCVAA